MVLVRKIPLRTTVGTWLLPLVDIRTIGILIYFGLWEHQQIFLMAKWRRQCFSLKSSSFCSPQVHNQCGLLEDSINAPSILRTAFHNVVKELYFLQIYGFLAGGFRSAAIRFKEPLAKPFQGAKTLAEERSRKTFLEPSRSKLKERCGISYRVGRFAKVGLGHIYLGIRLTYSCKCRHATERGHLPSFSLEKPSFLFKSVAKMCRKKLSNALKRYRMLFMIPRSNPANSLI